MGLDVITTKLVDLAGRVAMIEKHRLGAADDYLTQPEARDLVSFNLMLAVQSAADIATHIAREASLAPARTVAESFDSLAAAGIVPSDLARGLRAAVGFRNVVAHGYARLDLAALQRAASTGVADLREFAQLIAVWTATRLPAGS